MNFTFLVMKTMRFYGWSWHETMNLPISAFWVCYCYVDRLRAEESLDRLNEQSYAWADEAGRTDIVQGLMQRKGTVVVEAPVFDAEGWGALKLISQH